MFIPSVVVKHITRKVTNLLNDEAFMLWGVNDRFTMLNNKLATISGVLEDIENREIKDVAIRQWLDKLGDIMYDTLDIINDCCLYLNHNNSSSSNQRGCALFIISAYNKCYEIISEILQCNFHRPDLGRRIDEVNDRLQQIHHDRTLLSFAVGSAHSRFNIHRVRVFGIDEDTKRLVQLLSGPKGEEGCRVIAIVGMGGIGKTALAQKVYDKSNFEQKIWVCVSQNYNEIDVVKRVIKSAGGDHRQTKTKEELYNMMKDVLHGKQVLLVLDDMWSPGVWTKVLRVPFQSLRADTRVLITTRDGRIARPMDAVYTHKVQLLSDEDAWSLLCKLLSHGGELEEFDDLKDVGMSIVKTTHGLPMAVKIISGDLKREGAR